MTPQGLRQIAASAALLLAACAGAPQRPAQPALTVAPARSEALLKQLRREVRRIEPGLPGLERLGAVVQDGQLLVELPGQRLFERGEAQLQVAALKPLAELAQAIAAYGATVVQVVGFGADDTAAALAERRAATLVEDFERYGLAPARLRAEARIEPAAPEALLELVLRPVIEGDEQKAWLPPSLAPAPATAAEGW